MFETTEKQYFGNDTFIHFFGIVEDHIDPRQLGRLKVRVIGDHNQDKEQETGIPTEDLPWAIVINPITSSAMNGIGSSPVGIVNGTWVFGFWLDGKNKQHPAILGTLIGVPEREPDGEIGFHDPDETFPMQQFLEEPDTNRLARGELDEIRAQYTDCEGNKLPSSKVEKKGDEKDPYPFLYPMNIQDSTEHEILRHKRSNLECNKETFLTTWHEPITQYNAEYPFNSVQEFYFDDEKHGHVEEWDSTPEHERYHRYHSSGSFLEIFNDPVRADCGTKVEKIVGENFELDLKNKHLYVKGDYRKTIDGNVDEHIKGNWFMHLEGCMVWEIDGQCINMPTEPLESTGDCKDNLGGVIPGAGGGNYSVDITVEGDWQQTVHGFLNKDIDDYETTNAPTINENATTINEDATTINEDATTINEEANNINNKSNYGHYESCVELHIEADTLLMETCMLIQKVTDMEMIIEPCSIC